MDKPDIIGVFESEGAKFIRKGRYLWCCCLLHKEKSPSCKIDQEKQIYYCFGCNQGGDVISFIRKHHSLTFEDTLDYLGMRNNRSSRWKPTKRVPDLMRLFQNFIHKEYLQRCEKVVRLYEFQQRSRNTPIHDDKTAFLYAELISELPRLEYELDILRDGSGEDKMRLFQEIVQSGKKRS